MKGLKTCRTFEVPFANANGAVVTPEKCRLFGHGLANALRELMLASEKDGSAAGSKWCGVLYESMIQELHRQQNNLELIASENLVSPAVMAAQGSFLTNKYAEGYPGHRYYGGCEFVDVAEELAIARAKELFGCNFANVQPHSGSNANFAVYYAVLNPGDTILGMDLANGGHLTHGAKVNVSGKIYNAFGYKVNPDTGVP